MAIPAAIEELCVLGIMTRVSFFSLNCGQSRDRASWGPRLLSLVLWYPNPEELCLSHPTTLHAPYINDLKLWPLLFPPSQPAQAPLLLPTTTQCACHLRSH